jgi:hypothetical protein
MSDPQRATCAAQILPALHAVAPHLLGAERFASASTAPCLVMAGARLALRAPPSASAPPRVQATRRHLQAAHSKHDF